MRKNKIKIPQATDRATQKQKQLLGRRGAENLTPLAIINEDTKREDEGKTRKRRRRRRPTSDASSSSGAHLVVKTWPFFLSLFFLFSFSSSSVSSPSHFLAHGSKQTKKKRKESSSPSIDGSSPFFTIGGWDWKKELRMFFARPPTGGVS